MTDPLTPLPEQATAPPRPSAWLAEARHFVNTIDRISTRDPGARAALRSGLGKDLADIPRMHRIVAPLIPAHALGDDDAQRAFYTVAALLASQRPGAGRTPDGAGTAGLPDDTPPSATGHSPAPITPPAADTTTDDRSPVPAATAAQRRHLYGESLGLAYAAAVARGTRNGIRESAAETRLNLLTRQSTSGLHRHLPAAVRQLCDKSTPPDWAKLLVDLRAWPRDRKHIARRWLQDFYRARRQAELDAARATDDATSLPAANTPVR